MQIALRSNKYGLILYEENVWTGKVNLSIDGVPLVKGKKRVFFYNVDNRSIPVKVKGNSVMGVRLLIDNAEYVLSNPPKKYEFAIAILAFVFMMVWGTSKALCSIVPIIGGAIGGAINGVCQFSSLVLMKKQEKVGVKLLVGLGMLALNFFLCYLGAVIFLAIFS